MKTAIKILVAIMFFLALATYRIDARSQDSTSAKRLDPIGFVDKDKDGINDRFCDANGDGINDVTGKAYPHKFPFRDKNQDGVNDQWVDRDGDGVNDLTHKLSKARQRDIDKCILDLNKDSINDITGFKYGTEDFAGCMFGFIDEKTGNIQGHFIDANGNGVDDRIEASRIRNRRHNQDFFIDEDGDGIADGRGDALRRQRRARRQNRDGKQK